MATPVEHAERGTQNAERGTRIDVLALDPPPRLIINPRAGQKLGMSTNAASLEAVQRALAEVGMHVRVMETVSPRHATQLARQAAQEGCKLVIAAGGDGTLAETGQGLVGTDP